MGIKNITERILSDARKKASEIESEDNKKAAEILNEAKNKSKSLRSQIVSSAKSQAEDEKRRILAFARLEARNSILTERQKAVGSVFEKAFENLLSLSDQEYFQLIKSLLIKTTITGEEEIILSSKDKNRITKELIESVNVALRSDGRKGNLKLAEETREIKGGFVLKSDGVEINNSFSSLLGLLREELEFKILEMLS
jgi:V/A-type H+-transporting ATPase subunit E